MVLLGSILMFMAAVAGWTLAGVMASKADRVIEPVAQICRQNTAASVELTSSGTCAAADQARQAGPYVVTNAGGDGADGDDGRDGADAVSVPGRDGRNGTDGENGADGTDGEDGTDGDDGMDGVDGQSPPCLTEPMQCRGADGRDGRDGAPAPASGTYLLPDGRTVVCTRAAGTDLDPIYRCQFNDPTPTEPTPGTE